MLIRGLFSFKDVPRVHSKQISTYEPWGIKWAGTQTCQSASSQGQTRSQASPVRYPSFSISSPSSPHCLIQFSLYLSFLPSSILTLVTSSSFRPSPRPKGNPIVIGHLKIDTCLNLPWVYSICCIPPHYNQALSHPILLTCPSKSHQLGISGLL